MSIKVIVAATQRARPSSRTKKLVLLATMVDCCSTSNFASPVMYFATYFLILRCLKI